MAGSGKKADEVYRWLMAYIDENKFSCNLKLPSENALCRRLDMSRETVRRFGPDGPGGAGAAGEGQRHLHQ